MPTISGSGKAAPSPAEETTMANIVDKNRDVEAFRQSLRTTIAERNALIRDLRAQNKRYWTYNRLSIHLGCSPELISTIMRATRDAED